MPRIEQIPDSFYQPMQPYHYEFDNLPINSLLKKIDLINRAVDSVSDILRDANGTQGTLSNRLNQSIEANGHLKPDAIDDSLHHIGAHEDGVFDDGNGPQIYVRMTGDERDKLDAISDEANLLTIEFPGEVFGPSSISSISTISTISTISNTPIIFDNGNLKFENSSTITMQFIPPNRVKFHTALPVNLIRNNFYDISPLPANLSNPDYINYKVNSLGTPYIEDSLRVYVNGLRLSSTETIYVPPANGGTDWKATSFTSNHLNGTFSINRALSANDVIRIDFDLSYS